MMDLEKLKFEVKNSPFSKMAAENSSKGTGKRGHIVAHEVSWAAQTGKHLLKTQNVSEQNQKHFLYSGHKICVRNKYCARGQTGKHLCRQQCVLVCQGLKSQLKNVSQH